MSIIDTFKKQGGFKLIKQYYYGGALFTAILQFLILGKNRTALEILRLSASLKIKKKLYKKYKDVLINFEKNYVDTGIHEKSNKVWICWFQGIDNAPDLVKKCYKSVKDNMPDKNVILITSENMHEYVKFPEYILKKWNKGIITHTHLTDLLRLELLIKYGGIWIDSTVYCSSSTIPEYYFESDLFFYQCLKPGRDGHCEYISSWLMSAKSNNKILLETRELCYSYWKDNNVMWDYYLLHDLFAIVLDSNEELWKKIIPRDNATPHLLLLKLFDKYDDKMWNAIKEQTPFHKLTYKFDENQKKIPNTYYKKLIIED